MKRKTIINKKKKVKRKKILIRKKVQEEPIVQLKEEISSSSIMVTSLGDWGTIKKEMVLKVKSAYRTGGEYSAFIHGVDPQTRKKKVIQIVFNFGY